jgi:cytochrome c peroxidase
MERQSRVFGPTLALTLLFSCNDGSSGGNPLPTVQSATVSAQQLRSLIDRQVGGIETLMVPADNADLPQPLLDDGTPDPFFQTTEAKRFLGKQLFHDPVRAVRIVPEFGGVPATAQTATCGSCHLGEAASKAGTALNFAVGGEGKGYTDADGNFIPRRRARTDILPQLRSVPLFPGDALVDALPTLTDVYEFTIGSPARGQLPGVGELLATGRLDAVDSVGRMAPSVIGFAFNNRLLLDGFAGEPDETDGGLNPFGHPAQENLTLLLLDAHRMIGLGPQGMQTQAEALQEIPAFVQLFRDAFPEEAAEADDAGDLDLLVNDLTVVRATASFLRTVVTRNTPWDRFLSGDDQALTEAQRRGARLFFTEAKGGAGAGCFSCHSGPMLNKQFDDADVTGVGELVEENFFNLGLADHPLQALNREARLDRTFRDEGRKEITGRDEDAFEFRTLTLRQLRDARNFMHNALFTSVKEVVEYFNAGIPQDEEAGSAPTITPRFTNPRGPGFPQGLGLGSGDVADLTDFIENALYDPAFARFDPDSTTDLFQLSERDVTYSVYRPDLAALGAVDGFPVSGLAQDNDDPLSRRDQGLEFLDVTYRLDTELVAELDDRDVYRISNNGLSVVDTHLLVVVQDLPAGVLLENASGMTKGGDPFVRVFLDEGVLRPGESVDVALSFSGEPGPSYDLVLLSGQGAP